MRRRCPRRPEAAGRNPEVRRRRRDKPVDAATVRSADNECWTIPKLADDKAKFPFDIVVAPCDSKADRQLKFFFEKS